MTVLDPAKIYLGTSVAGIAWERGRAELTLRAVATVPRDGRHGGRGDRDGLARGEADRGAHRPARQVR